MISIAICDDYVKDRQRIFEFVSNYMATCKKQYVIETHESGKTLIDAARRKSFDLIFLDIILDDINGINVAEKIRTTNSKVCIIFISSSREFAVDGYSVNAFGYLVKPVEDYVLKNLLDKFLERYLIDEERSVTIRSEGININVPIEKIIYIESQDKKLFLHLSDGTDLMTYAKLDELNLIMSKFENFLRCHKSYLLNMDHVTSISDNKFVMAGGAYLPIPRESITAKKKAYYDYIIDKE